MSDAFWLFAYGSLIWRPKFEFEHRVRCYVDGYARRFWQASADHRGTPDAPGRVVTLVPAVDARCWGVAYRIGAAEAPSVIAQLDEREKGGYSRISLTCQTKDRTAQGTLEATTYVAVPTNPLYVGSEPLAQTAQIIRTASGPSGHNAEYALRLAEALLELEAIDDHVFAIANLVSDPDAVVEEP